jgi:hypothetical protein
MNTELWQELRIADVSTIWKIEHVQKCIAIYEETLRAMGLVPRETMSETLSDSELTYSNPVEIVHQYANIPDNY